MNICTSFYLFTCIYCTPTQILPCLNPSMQTIYQQMVISLFGCLFITFFVYSSKMMSSSLNKHMIITYKSHFMLHYYDEQQIFSKYLLLFTSLSNSNTIKLNISLLLLTYIEIENIIKLSFQHNLLFNSTSHTMKNITSSELLLNFLLCLKKVNLMIDSSSQLIIHMSLNLIVSKCLIMFI